MTTIYLSSIGIQVAEDRERVLERITEARRGGESSVTFTTLVKNSSGFPSAPMQESDPITIFVEHIQGVK